MPPHAALADHGALTCADEADHCALTRGDEADHCAVMHAAEADQGVLTRDGARLIAVQARARHRSSA